MPTRVIAGNAGNYLLYQDVIADPAVLISGSDNNIVVIGGLAGTAGAAVVFTGVHNTFRVDQGGSVTGSGTTAIQGSDHQDLIGNNRGTIAGNVQLGGGDDHFQNNFDSPVGQVFGGSGDDSLRTYEGSIALAYFGESGDDFLSGGSAGDQLDGGGDSDRLHGLGGNDQLTGGSGADVLAGGLGNDQLAGGGDEGDMALFEGLMSAFDVDMAGGAGSVTDMDASDGDQGSDTLSGISILRFTDQQVDLRIARNGLVLTEPGEAYTNTINRYDYFAVELRGEGVHFVNTANIVGTAVPHTAYVEPYGQMSVSTGALALSVYNATVENRAGASIVGFDDAIGMTDHQPTRAGDGLAVVNDGLIRSLEGDAIDFHGYLTVTNGSTGVIEAVSRVTSRAAINAGNSVVEIFNAGRIEGVYALNTGILLLENDGIIVGTIESSYRDSRIDNRGSITGRYEAWGGITFLNSGQSAGDLRIDVHPVGQYSNQSYTYAALDNRDAFTGDIKITGTAQFISAPPVHADFLATIANSGTINGSIVSNPTLAAPAGGGTADASFVEAVVNSGTITGDVRLGDGNDSLVNSGRIAGLVDGGAGNDTLEGGANADRLQGGAGNDVVRGGGGDDVLRLDDGGDETVEGGAGNDNIFFIGALTAADLVNGGAGVDTLVVQGPYGALTLTANVTQIENISILGGNNTNFGEPGTNRYDYVLTTRDANFAAGVQARINGAALLAGEDFTFNGSAETNASFVVYGGKGRDTLTGGLGNDIFFYAEDRFASGDTVNGGAGYDGMFLRGNYTIDFNAPGYTGLFTNIENLTLTSATDERYARGGGTEFDYNLTLSNAIVNAGQTLTISGALLTASETMILDGSQETNGMLRLFGGAAADTLKGGALADLLHGAMGADTLRGGGGADIFRYQAVTESYSVARDHIIDFTPGTDKIDLGAIDASRSAGGDQAFAWIGSNAFSKTAGELRAFQSGGQWIVQGDINGDGFADLIVALTLQGPTPLGAGDFVL